MDLVLINFMGSEFVTWMDRFHKECPGAAEPDADSEEQKFIQDKGLEHERAFLETLAAQGKQVCDLREAGDDIRPTLAAMRRGEEIIYQGYLAFDDFAGYPDFLVRVDAPSDLGAWRYEPWDTKLARHPKPYFLVQLCCYAEMLERAQGVRPQALRVVLGGSDAERADFRTDDFFYYYLALKEAFLEQQSVFDARRRPEIPPLRDLGRWSEYADRELTARDDLALIADIRTSQIHKLRAAGFTTVTRLATSDDGVRVPRMSEDTLRRLRRQAALQVASRGAAVPEYELLTPDETDGPHGLRLLPPPSSADVFFDTEGFPLIDDGREYLFGACYREGGGHEGGGHEGGKPGFRDWWAHSPAEEKRAFEGFVRWVHGRWQQDRSLHIYHYNHYEVTALRRLMGKYGVCEQEVDELLHGQVFVDLYRIVRQSVTIGEPSYSLKYVEHLYRGRREGDVASASASMVFYQRWLMAHEGKTPETSAILKQIRDYNEQDCHSTAELAEWTGARMIAALLRAGKRVGIASNSHRAINVLLGEAWRAAIESGLDPKAVKVGNDEEHRAGLPPEIPRVDNGRKLFENGSLPDLIGGTVFAFIDAAAEGALDYLFVDEAGQVSEANLAAMAPAARNLILLGDQMQLGQPIQGSHPGESGLSTLEYLLEGRATMPLDFGIFLARTWRLHPDLCRFISGAVYEDRLGFEAHTGERVLVAGPNPPDWLHCTAGLVYVPVEHEGNVFESVEEEDRIAALVRDLLGLRLRRKDGTVRPLVAADILVVAPYNLQVRRLARRLGDVRAGTVDKFQGQEAAVVIFSMCASSGDSSPRGIEFLFSRNRLNVAISRAETLAVVVASPELVRTRCSSIEQIGLVNVYCRAVREGTLAAAAMGAAL